MMKVYKKVLLNYELHLMRTTFIIKKNNFNQNGLMRSLIITTVLICITACSPEQPKTAVIAKVIVTKDTLSIDSCFVTLYIDSTLVESTEFKKFWNAAQELGYTFFDDTIVPFAKIIFQSKSAKYYSDSLGINECKIFDSVNIHRIEIRSPVHTGKYRYSNLNVDEWEFKDIVSALRFAKGMSNFFNKGYGLKSPMDVLLYKHSVYIFQTADYAFINEMERMEKVLNVKPNIIGSNY